MNWFNHIKFKLFGASVSSIVNDLDVMVNRLHTLADDATMEADFQEQQEQLAKQRKEKAERVAKHATAAANKIEGLFNEE
jgi:hypothetical protein